MAKRRKTVDVGPMKVRVKKEYCLPGGQVVSAKYVDQKLIEDEAIVDLAENAYWDYINALSVFNAFKSDVILPVFDVRVAERDDGKDTKKNGKGMTVYDASRKRRVMIKKPAHIKLNEYATEAQSIIDEKIKEWERELPEEAQDLFPILKGMFVDRRKLSYTPALAAFMSLFGLRDKDLRKAQDLLKKAMVVDMGRLTMIVEKQDDEGKWEQVGGGK